MAQGYKKTILLTAKRCGELNFLLCLSDHYQSVALKNILKKEERMSALYSGENKVSSKKERWEEKAPGSG